MYCMVVHDVNVFYSYIYGHLGWLMSEKHPTISNWDKNSKFHVKSSSYQCEAQISSSWVCTKLDNFPYCCLVGNGRMIHKKKITCIRRLKKNLPAFVCVAGAWSHETPFWWKEIVKTYCISVNISICIYIYIHVKNGSRWYIYININIYIYIDIISILHTCVYI